jgi:hypothetical protein
MVLLLAAALLGWPFACAAQSGLEIMQAQRERHRVADEHEVLLMRIVSATGRTKERRLASYALTPARGSSKSLLRFLAPRDVEHTGLLTWEAPDGDDEQWLYLPATRKVKRIVSGSKKNRFMGSDFAYEDLRPENLALHSYTLVGTEVVDGHPCFLVEARPTSERQAADSGYSRRRLWIRQDLYVTVKQEYFDKRDRREKVSTGQRFVNVGGQAWRPDEIEMRDVQAGTRTVVVVEHRRLDQGLHERFFTLTELTRIGP